VLKEATDAIEDYDSREIGWRGIFTRGMRNLGAAANDGAVDPWLDLLPDSQYTSIVFGGLKLIIGVCPFEILLLLKQIAN
jgi:hypothetical protein